MLVMSKEDSTAVFESTDFQFQQLASNVTFLQSLPLFSPWSRSRLTRLLSVMVHRIYPAGELIVRQVCPRVGVYTLWLARRQNWGHVVLCHDVHAAPLDAGVQCGAHKVRFCAVLIFPPWSLPWRCNP